MVLYANVTGYITSNAVLNSSNDKHISCELFHIVFEVYSLDPLISIIFSYLTKLV